MLFLKRASDLFGQRREDIKKEGKAAGLLDADIALNLEDPDQYSGKYFYVPPHTSWNDPWVDDAGNTQAALKHVKENVGSTMPSLNNDVMNRLSFPFLSPAEPGEITQRLDFAEQKINALQDELSKLKQQKRGLMHDLLTGKVPVKVEEP